MSEELKAVWEILQHSSKEGNSVIFMAQQLCGIQFLLKEPGLSEQRLLIRAGIIFVLYKQQHNPLIL